MTFRLVIMSLFIVFSLYLEDLAVGEEHHSSAEPQVFTNKDLVDHSSQAGNGMTVTKPSAPYNERYEAKKAETSRVKEQKEQEYWCKKASGYKKKIEKARVEVEEIEKRLSELESSASISHGKAKKSITREINSTNKALLSNKKILREREEDLRELEDEAHRKSVPPGWLRCQFSG